MILGSGDRGKAVGVKPTYSEGTTGTTARIRNVRGLRDRHDVCQRDKKKRKFPPTAGGGRAEARAKKYFFFKKKSILKNNSTGTRLRCVENGIGHGSASILFSRFIISAY